MRRGIYAAPRDMLRDSKNLLVCLPCLQLVPCNPWQHRESEFYYDS